MKVGQSNNKKSVLEQLLGQGMVLVAFDARVDGVDVPDHLQRDPQLRLNLSYRFGRPIAIDPWGINAQLTFGGVPYDCRITLAAVFLIVSHVSGEPHLFPDDVPPELLNQASGALELPDTEQARAKATEPGRPRLSLVPHEGEDEGEEQPDEPAKSRGPVGKLRPAAPVPVATEPPDAPADSDDGDKNDAKAAAKKRGSSKKAAQPRKKAPDDQPAPPEAPKDPPPQPRAKRLDRSHLRVIK